MEDFILTDEDNLLKPSDKLIMRMAEIRDNVNNEWIANHLKTNKVLLKIIVSILAEVDCMGIINCGAPPDEYSPEAKSILLRQSEWETVDALEKVIAEEFTWWFYLYDADDKVKYGSLDYKVAARQIWNAWLEIKGEPPVTFADKIELPPPRSPIIIEIE